MKTQEQGELYDDILFRAFNADEARAANETLVDVLDFLEGLISEEKLLEVTRHLDEVSQKIRDLDDEIDDLGIEKNDAEENAYEWQATAEEAQDRLKEQLTDALNRPKFVHLTDDLRGLEERSAGDDRELIARALEILEGIEQEVLA